MRISLSDIGKRYNRDWIFRHCTYIFETGNTYAITGPNGSGKSTLCQIIAGSLIPSEGQLTWLGDGPSIDPDKIYRLLSMTAPYMEVIEEMTLLELLTFHSGFKPWISGITSQDIITQTDLESYSNKQIRYFSSGMKQRVKLAQALFSDTPVLLLDEPCSNLDVGGYDLYHRLIQRYAKDRLVIVSSNDPAEYDFCTVVLPIQAFKP